MRVEFVPEFIAAGEVLEDRQICNGGGVKGKFVHGYGDIVSVENLLAAWEEFVIGKRSKPDIQEFGSRLMENILILHDDLQGGMYAHGGYRYFTITDPKRRDIHKACVRDRLVHHAIYRILYPLFDRKFLADSYSCRLGKGTHKALDRFRAFARTASKNNTCTAWVLKCDIRKFFANIDHDILLNILRSHIHDADILRLVGSIVSSFNTHGKTGVGLPLGNLTSQLLVNIYMNEFDRFVKYGLRERHYIRYADDFIVFSESRAHLERLIPRIAEFLNDRLRLELHPDKLFIKTAASGVDFLGWVHFPDHRVLRTATKRRMVRRVRGEAPDAAISSYRGLLSHGNARKLSARHL